MTAFHDLFDDFRGLNCFGLPQTGNGRNSIMVALADWLITPTFLQLEILSSLLRWVFKPIHDWLC